LKPIFLLFAKVKTARIILAKRFIENRCYLADFFRQPENRI
jgi:hypothetical protein